MFVKVKNKLKAFENTKKESQSQSDDITPKFEIKFYDSLEDNLKYIENKFKNCSDLVIKRFSKDGVNIAVVAFANLYDKEIATLSIIEPILKQDFIPAITYKYNIYREIMDSCITVSEVSETDYIDEFTIKLMTGFCGILVDGFDKGALTGLHKISQRSVTESDTTVVVRGPKDGFVEVLATNISLVRKRIKSSELKFEVGLVGKKSKTNYALCYMEDKISQKVLKEVKKRLNTIELDYIMESGYIEPYLEDNIYSMFPTVGVTDRPDVLCGKISEGRIGIMVDGTPFCLYVPYVFPEVLQNPEDYYQRMFYGTVIRWVRLAALFISLFLPSFYVALTTFHQEALPPSILYNIAKSQQTTPFPIVLEALIIHFIYELLREAGIRLPKPVGQAIGIVGALVIGDAAVSAGIMGAPMVIVVALTAIASFAVSEIYETVFILRYIFILAAGFCGFYGIMLCLSLVLIHLCSLKSFGVPYLSPISPFDKTAQRDMFIRSSWPFLKKTIKIENMNGSKEE